MTQPAPQPFDPLRYLHFARALAQAPGDEPGLRTAISRAYYAPFLIARTRTGVALTSSNVHTEVHREVRRRHPPTGSQLAALRRMRNVADYDLLPANPQNRNWAANWQSVDAIVRHILPRIQRL